MSCESLIQKIIVKEFVPFEPWSSFNRQGGNFYAKIKQIRSLLNIISGGEIPNMIKDLLSDQDNNFFTERFLAVNFIILKILVSISKKNLNLNFFFHRHLNKLVLCIMT